VLVDAADGPHKLSAGGEEADGEESFEREGAVSERGWSRNIYGRSGMRSGGLRLVRT